MTSDFFKELTTMNMLNLADNTSGFDTTDLGLNMSGFITDKPNTDPGRPSFLTRFICETAVSMPLSLLGIVGNVLACIVLCRQRPRFSTTVLLQGLATTDTFVLISTILFRSLRYIYYHYHTLEGYYSVYHYIFRWGYPFVYFFRMTDMWFTVLLTIDRFVAVCRPLHAQSACTIPKTHRNMFFIALASFIFCIPRFFEYEIYPDDPRKFYFRLTPLIQNQVYTIAYRIVLFFILMYQLPITILVVLNAKLLLALHEADSYRANIRQKSGHKYGPKSHRSITVIVITVVSITIVCNLTAMVSHLLWSLHECYKVKLSHLELYRRYIALISNVLVTFNSAVNFIIYCLCSRNFRLILSRICCRLYGFLPTTCCSRSRKSKSRRTRWSSTKNSSIRTQPNGTYISLVQHNSSVRAKMAAAM